MGADTTAKYRGPRPRYPSMTATTLRRASALVLVFGVVLSTVFATTAATAASASIDHEGDTLTVRAESGQTVSGTTSLSADEEVSVRLQGQGAEAFLTSKTTTTGEEGAFEVTFDLSDVDPSAAGPVSVSVVHDGTTLASTEAQFTTASTDTGDSTGNAPGFGVLAALCGLVGAAALARRR